MLHPYARISLNTFCYITLRCISFMRTILFYRETPKAVFSRVAKPRAKSIFFTRGATNENITVGVYEWNINRSKTEKVKFSVSFMLKNCNNLVYSKCVSQCDKDAFFLPVCITFDSATCLLGMIFVLNIVFN